MANPHPAPQMAGSALARIARRLRLPYSRSFVAAQVARHPQPDSLLALAEVGEKMGIKVTPAEVDPQELEDLDLPILVQVKEREGFGVLERVSSDSFFVWDALDGLRSIPRVQFFEQLSGAVGVVERAGRRDLKEKRHLLHRLADAIFTAGHRPEIAGGRMAKPLRSALGLLVLGLIALSLLNLPSSARAPAAVVAVLSLVGLSVALVTAVSIESEAGLSDGVCKQGKFVNCHSVLTSRYSSIFGIPFADIGVAFFASLLLVMAIGAAGAPLANWWVVSVALAASIPVSLGLIAAQIVLREFCTLCLAVHLTNFSGVAVAWVWLQPPVPSLEASLVRLLLFVLFFLTVLFVAVPVFKQHRHLGLLSARFRRITTSPFTSLAELLTERPTGVPASSAGLPVNTPRRERHDLLFIAHPSCPKCDLALRDVRALTEAGLVNTYMGLAPRKHDEADRRACTAVLAAARSMGGERVFDVYLMSKEHLDALMSEDPAALLSELLPGTPDMEGHLKEASELVRQSEVLEDLHGEGTPAIFVNSRLYRGPLSHLATLLEEHDDLLRVTASTPQVQSISA